MRTLLIRLDGWAAAVFACLTFWLTVPDAGAQDLARNPYWHDARPSTVLQSVAPSSWSVGLRARASRTEFAGDAAGRTQAQLTLGGGAYVRAMFGSTFAIQPEVIYSPWQARVNHNGGLDGPKDARYTMRFAEIPLLFKGYLEEGDGRQFYLAAGPYASVRLSGKAESQYNPNLAQQDLDDMFRKWDYGAQVGIGMEEISPMGSMFFDVRYSIGLTNLFAESDRPDFRARGLTFSLGVGT